MSQKLLLPLSEIIHLNTEAISFQNTVIIIKYGGDEKNILVNLLAPELLFLF